ncbi:SDR family oxidoreductase [Streptomyces sp. NPDC004126]|uniref:SDR family oxidoreductase n=1 Tax=Streptomyces sp. NPDC004126 TaxID=3390695 RepID=UPI003D07E720
MTERHPQPRHVLLTGATGSLGSRVCVRLLDHATLVHCLVRGRDQQEATARLQHRLHDDHLTDIKHQGRLHAVPADITRPLLGLTPRSYDALAQTVGVIVHCAATVNLAAGYDPLAPVNVHGTRAVIAFAEHAAALTGRRPRLCAVSTLGTLIAARSAGHPVVDENTPATAETAGPLGYPRSKAAAEGELRAAAARGASITLLRPGIITGDPRTDATPFGSDLLAPLLRAAVALRAAPDTPAGLPLDTADAVSRATAVLALHPESAGRTFHLVRRRPFMLQALFAAARRAGHRLEPLPADRWWQRLDTRTDHPDVKEMIMLEGVYRRTFTHDADHGHLAPDVRADATSTFLEQAGIQSAALDDDYLDRLVPHLTAGAAR